MIIVSHWTIGANRECPSESFQMEGILAVKPYLKAIDRKPESDEVFLVGYSQGGSTTLGVMRILQDEFTKELPIKAVYAGGGPYDLTATFDITMLEDKTGIPCAIPMIVQGVNEGENLGLNLSDFFKPILMEHLDDWINSKRYSVGEINAMLNASSVSDLMTDEGRDKSSPQTAKLYRTLMWNSILLFTPRAPVYIFHSMDDNTDFKLIVFQIHPETHEILGNPVVTEFRTKPVPERELYFEVNFEGELLTITPSDNNLTYFWQFKESDQIYDDYGTATYYLYSVAGMYQEYGFMEMLYSQGSVEWDFAMENNMHDGTEYLLIISGCEEGELTTPTTIAKFRYHPGHIEILEIFEENDW